MIIKILQTLRVIKNTHIFILDHFGLLGKNRCIKYDTKTDASFYVRAGTSDINEIIIIHSDSEYPKRYFPSKKNPTILDIGALIGGFSIYIDNI
jgi:hypothetical protein